VTQPVRPCAVCGKDGDRAVCGRCQQRMAGQLAELPGMARRLAVALVPGGGGGERVTASREAPLPLRLAALSLTAGGSDEARCFFVPKARVWSTLEDRPVIDLDADGLYRETIQPVTVWHRELERDERGRVVMVAADDQAGTLPIKAWLLGWELDWRTWFGHSLERLPSTMVRKMRRDPPADRARVLLGIGPALPMSQRPDDPIEEELGLRFTTWQSDRVATRAHAYLTTWLPQAAERQPHIADFAVSLRGLVGAVRATLGEAEELEYVGRCPDEVVDRATEERSVCGAAIWHDPRLAVITCPRCRAETPEHLRIWLARRILDVWPIDPRRRYPRGLIATLRLPRCDCGETVAVDWVDATERQDRERFWRPGRVSCPAGCANLRHDAA
jgi:hypothetical protein